MQKPCTVIIQTARLSNIIHICITVTVFIPIEVCCMLNLCGTTKWSQISGEYGTVTALSIDTWTWSAGLEE